MIWFLFELMRFKTLNEYEQMTWILMSLSFAAARSKKAVLHQVSSLYLALIFMSTFHLDGTDTWHNFYPKKEFLK